MASTVITCPELHERGDEYIRSQLLEYVPMFRQNMDRGAGDLIGDLERIIKHRLWERIGFSSMEEYAVKHLQHSEQWCHEVIHIYRREWSPEERRKRTVGDLIERNAQIRADAETKTQAEVAAEHGISQQRVSQLTRGTSSKDTRKARVNLSPGTDPAAAAERIREKLGEEFAERLYEQLGARLTSQ